MSIPVIEDESAIDRILGYTQGSIQRPRYSQSVPSKLEIAPQSVKSFNGFIGQTRRELAFYFDDNSRTWESMNTVVDFIDTFVKYTPYVIDFPHEVDGGGFTRLTSDITRSTPWVNHRDIHLRLSEARTARHSSGLLRTKIDGKGFALEATSSLESNNPADMVTILIFDPEKQADARFSWVKPRDARVYDMSDYRDEPYFAGPLYNGYPKEALIQDDEQLHDVMDGIRWLIGKTLGYL